MTSLPCNIVLLPEANICKKAIFLSQDLAAKYDTLFTLQTGAFYPHVSLYMTQLKVVDMEKAKTLLGAIAATTPQVTLETSGYGQAEGYIDIEYDRSKAIADLQMLVVDAINPIRDGMREKDKARMLEATGKVRENLEQYGYRGVGKSFRPHLTLTRFADGRSIETSELPPPTEFSGNFTALGLFEMGDNGTCARLIADFELEGKN